MPILSDTIRYHPIPSDTIPYQHSMRLCLVAIKGDQRWSANTTRETCVMSAAGGAWRTSFLFLIIPTIFQICFAMFCLDMHWMSMTLKISGASEDGQKAIPAHESRAFNIALRWKCLSRWWKETETRGTLNTAAFGVSTGILTALQLLQHTTATDFFLPRLWQCA